MTPRGSERWTTSSRFATRSVTVRLFSPTSIMAVPITTSTPFSLAAPVLSSCPWPTVAMSWTRMGSPLRVATTTSRRSSSERSRPLVRTRYCSPLCSTNPPTAAALFASSASITSAKVRP